MNSIYPSPELDTAPRIPLDGMWAFSYDPDGTGTEVLRELRDDMPAKNVEIRKVSN